MDIIDKASRKSIDDEVRTMKQSLDARIAVRTGSAEPRKREFQDLIWPDGAEPVDRAGPVADGLKAMYEAEGWDVHVWEPGYGTHTPLTILLKPRKHMDEEMARANRAYNRWGWLGRLLGILDH